MGGQLNGDSWNTAAIVLGTSLCLIGLFLLVLWWRSRRHGDTPHCRGCGYNLTGLNLLVSPPPRCPECGETLVSRCVVRGERVRRRAAFAGVSILLAMGLALMLRGLWPTLSGVYWYQWKPGDLVIFDLESSDPKTVDRAVVEIARRIQTDSLWFWQRGRVIRRSLDVQALRLGSVQQERIYPEWLGVFAARDQLDDGQRQQFFRNSFQIEIAARKQALARFGVPLRFDFSWHGASAGMRGSFRIKSMTSGGQEIGRDSLELRDSVRLGSREVVDWLAPLSTPGPHSIRAELELEIRGSSIDQSPETVLYSEDRVFELSTNIVESLSTGEVALIDEDGQTVRQPSESDKRRAEMLLISAGEPGLSEEQRQSLKNAAASLQAAKSVSRDYVPEVTVHGVYLSRLTGGADLAECGVRFPENPPTGLAFDVVLKMTDGREIFLGHVAQFTFAPWQKVYYVKAQTSERLGGLVSVILRPSPAAAMQTFDLDRIYASELEFDDLPVMRQERP